MDSETTSRLRQPRFGTRMVGYDRREVDAFLAEVAERLETQRFEDPVTRAGDSEIAGLAEKVEEVVAAAREAAEHLRAETARRAAEVTEEADSYAKTARREADEYARSTRAEADEHASSVLEAAKREAAEVRAAAEADARERNEEARNEADGVLSHTRREKTRIEGTIDELRERRELILAELERLRGNLSTMVGQIDSGTIEWDADDVQRATEEIAYSGEADLDDAVATGVDQPTEAWEAPAETAEDFVDREEADADGGDAPDLEAEADEHPEPSEDEDGEGTSGPEARDEHGSEREAGDEDGRRRRRHVAIEDESSDDEGIRPSLL